MQSIKTNEDNDLFLSSDGNIAMCSGLEAIEQAIKNAVQTLYAEMNLDADKGIPYFDTIFTANPDLELFRQYIIDTIEEVEGVISVTDYSYEIKDDIYKYTAYITTIYGDTVLNG